MRGDAAGGPAAKHGDSQWVGYVYVMVAAAMWGLIGPIARFAFAAGVSPLEVAFWRAVLAWALFAPHAVLCGKARIAVRHLPSVIAFGVVCVAVFYGAYQGAVKAGGAALASMLLYTAPAWVAIVARFVLGEPRSRTKLVAVGVTLVGVAAISLGGGGLGSVSPLAVVLGLVAGLTYAAYYIFGKYFLGYYAIPTLFLYALPVGALVLWPFVDFAPKTLTAWAAMGFVALVSTYGAYLFYYTGLRRLEATRAAVVATLEPVVAAITAWLWWGEHFGPYGYLGSALILGAVVLIVSGGRRRDAPERSVQ